MVKEMEAFSLPAKQFVDLQSTNNSPNEVPALLNWLGERTEDGGVVDMPGRSKGKIRVTSRAKSKTKRLLKVDAATAVDFEEDYSLNDLKDNPAFAPSHLTKKRRLRPVKTADKTLKTFHSIGNAIIHPKDAIKSKATKTTANQLSKADRPYLSQKADLEYLQAHDNLKRAESIHSSKRGTSDEEQNDSVGNHRENVRKLEAHRESLRAAWTTSRHVRRVRVVPKRHIDFPDNEFFVERDNNGNIAHYDWMKWLGYVRYPYRLQRSVN